jgi:sulfur carrier protein
VEGPDAEHQQRIVSRAAQLPFVIFRSAKARPFAERKATQSVNLIVNGQPQHVSERLTVADLLARLQLPAKGVAVELNEQVVPRLRHSETELRDGDRLEVVSLVGGG